MSNNFNVSDQFLEAYKYGKAQQVTKKILQASSVEKAMDMLEYCITHRNRKIGRPEYKQILTDLLQKFCFSRLLDFASRSWKIFLKSNVNPAALLAFGEVFFRYYVSSYQGLDAARSASKDALTKVWKRNSLPLVYKKQFTMLVVTKVAPKGMRNVAAMLVNGFAPKETLESYHKSEPGDLRTVDPGLGMTVLQVLCSVMGPEALSAEEEKSCQFIVDNTPFDIFEHVEPRANMKAIDLANNMQLKSMIIEKYKEQKNNEFIDFCQTMLENARAEAASLAHPVDAEGAEEENPHKRQRTDRMDPKK